MKRVVVTLAGAVALALVAGHAIAAEVVAGKSAVFAAEQFGALNPIGDTSPLTAQLPKGRKRAVLRIDASVAVQADASGSVPSVYLEPSVNSQAVTPAGFSSVCDPQASHDEVCTVSATFFFDLDAAEAQQKGFNKNPIQVSLIGGSTRFAGAGLPYQASFTAEIIRK